MRYPKFGVSEREIKALVSPIFSITEIVVPIKTLNVIDRCPADNRVFECALEGKCSVIVTGDRRDLLSLEKFNHIRILSPKIFLDQIY